MRTTVTLDEDVVRSVRARMHERGTGFKETLNELVRRGLHSDARSPEPYEMPVFDSPIRAGVDLDKALALAGALEDEETLRKLEMGK